MLKGHRFITLTVAVMGVAALPAGAPVGAQSQTPTFRSSTNVVQVDVRVFKDNQFVTGLGSGDFTVTEDGIPQKIESVVLIGASSGPLPPSSLAFLARASETPSVAEKMARSVWVFVFDMQHLSPAGLEHTRNAVLKFLDEKWHQGDLGGVVADGQLAHNRLTSDRAELRDDVATLKMPGGLESLRIEMTREWPRFEDEFEVLKVGVDTDEKTLAAVVARACDEDHDQCNRQDPRVQVLGKAHLLASEIQQSTLSTLRSTVAVSNGLGRMPGPKTVVFLSEGFAIDTLESQMQRAVGEAARAGVHFYTIDARGLNHASASSSIFDQPVVESLFGKSVRFDVVSDGTNSLAVDTGGLVIKNENDFGRALDEIRTDASEYYVIAYSPTNTNFDGKYRAIGVSVSKPGVQVRARRGYLALAPAMLLEPTPARASHPSAAAVERVPDLPVVPAAGVADIATVANRPAPPAAAARAGAESGVLALKKLRPSADEEGDATLGWAAYERGDLETAASDLSKAAETDNRPWISFALGYAQFALRRYPEAIAAWMRVKQSVPQFEPVYFSLADALSLEGKDKDGIALLSEAERRWPKDAEIENALGVLLVRRDALDRAIESFTKATELAPDDASGYFNLGRAYQIRFAKAEHYNMALGRVLGGNETDRSAAIAAFKKCLELHGAYDQQAREAISALGGKN